MTSIPRGILLILSGPAGAGKTTFARRLCETFDRCVPSISATTRAPRPREVDGRDYFFLDREDFEQRIGERAFAEHAEFSGNLYGTPKSFLEENLSAGRHVILDIEVKGAAQLRRTYPEAVKVFLLPPSPEDLTRRLRERRTESEEEIQRRLEIARNEILRLESYDYFVVNDDMDRTFERLTHILRAEERRIRGGECDAWLDGRHPEDVLR
jgi:guanylate kinase